VAVAALAAAVLLRWLLDPVMGDTLPLVTLFGAVAAVVWIGGYGPAVLVAILGYLACDYFFIEPRGELSFARFPNAVGLIAYLFTCSLIIGFGEAMRLARRRASERGELLRVTLGSIGDAVITTDLEGRVTYLNPVAESLTGWSQRDALGHPLDAVFRIVNEHSRQPVESPVRRALREGTVVGLANHTILVRKDGSERPIDDSAAPISDERGRVSGCVLIFRDVSERRRLENVATARLHSARALASIVESTDDAIVGKSLDGTIQSWNDGAARLFGHSAARAIGRHISLIIPPERLAEEDQIIASLKAGRRVDHFQTERLRSDGSLVPVSLTISPIMDEAGKVVGASKIARDVTREKQAEAERQKFITLLENSTDFIGMCDLEGVPFFVNRAGLELVGLRDMDEARRTNVRDFFFPEDQAMIMGEFFASVTREGHGEVDVRFRHFRTGEALWMAYKVLVLVDAAGKPVAFGTVSQNVTERRRLADDLRKLAADLSDADRRKDEFLATLAHELRNPLAPLRNMLEILKRAEGDRELNRQALDTMERQLGQLVRLVDDLLDLGRINHNRLELRMGTVDLASVLHQAVQACRPLADAAGHELEVELPREPVRLRADAVRLAQVFGNLLNNACKYTAPRGKIGVTAERRGPDVVVAVSDTGIGIPPDKLASIFDMFAQVDQSLEQSQGGLGIGLTLVKRLVEMHGGAVEAESAGPGRGSAFTVRLPVEPQGTEVAAPPPEAPQQPALPRRILVVDDNRDAASSLALLLQIAGNETHLAHDGAAALDAAERHRPDLVLLDIGLPALNGYEVCRQVRAQSWGREMVLIALTGWGQDEDRRKSREAGFDGHLVKPVDYPALLDLLGSLPAAGSAR
jgi:PAS domain S-box-containing protein